jgi:hypothetical protein
MVETLYLIPDGLFNFIMGIQATFLFTFLAFGTFLQVSGGDRSSPRWPWRSPATAAAARPRSRWSRAG